MDINWHNMCCWLIGNCRDKPLTVTNASMLNMFFCTAARRTYRIVNMLVFVALEFYP